jgi:hypothetical protein
MRPSVSVLEYPDGRTNSFARGYAVFFAVSTLAGGDGAFTAVVGVGDGVFAGTAVGAAFGVISGDDGGVFVAPETISSILISFPSEEELGTFVLVDCTYPIIPTIVTSTTPSIIVRV